MSGIMKKGSKFIYYAFKVERYNTPTDLKCSDCRNGVLYRTTTCNTDFTGGSNHFTSLADLMKYASALLDKGGSL